MKPGDFSRGTVTQIRQRDQDRCAWCGAPVVGERGTAPWNWQVHHREPRGQGGTSAPHVGRASNGVLLHGYCHAYIESHREEAISKGFIVSATRVDRPKFVPVEHAVHGRCLLDDDGGYSNGIEVF